ncbi:MAG: Wzz/FepE/Etk N-terminal domain-containing protein [Candidatus Cloacimonadales bacterium]
MKKHRIVDIVRTLVEGKKFIIIFTTIVAIIAIVYSLLTPAYWKSSTSFTINSSSGGLNIDLPGNLGSMLGSTGLGDILGGSSSETDFLNIINSRHFTEHLITKYDLMTYFKIKEADSLKAMDRSLKAFKNLAKATYNDKSHLLTISVESKSKQLSLDMCHYIREKSVELKEQKDKQKNELEFYFFQLRMDEYSQRLDNLLVSMKAFQEKYNILEMEQQAKAIISNYGEVITKATTVNIQADILTSLYGKDFPEVKIMQMQKDLINQEIKNLESISAKGKNKYIIGLEMMPEIANKYAALLVEKEIIEKTLVSFYPLYEASRFSSIKDNDLITVLDEPRMAGQRTKPKRAVIVVISTFLGFLFSAFLTFFWNSKSDSEKKEWVALWKQFWGKK